MKKLIFCLAILIVGSACFSQNLEKEFLKTYKRLNRLRSVDSGKDSVVVRQFFKLLDFLHDYQIVQRKLNGKTGFQFNGNENSINNLYKIGVSGSIDKGFYPYEVDFKVNIQSTLQDGVFQESISDIDISFDFHPLVQLEPDSKEVLWLENYVFIKRFRNNFLGIEQRYDAGTGFIFNFFEKNKLTREGIEYKAKLDTIPSFKVFQNQLLSCLKQCFVKKTSSK